MKTPHLPQILAATLAAAVLSAAALLPARAADEKLSISDVMKKAHKGDDSLFKKITAGNGTKDDFKTLVGLYENLPGAEPPKGDKADWEKRSKALLAAAKDVQAGKTGAIEELKKAGNCKACHTEHKPD